MNLICCCFTVQSIPRKDQIIPGGFQPRAGKRPEDRPAVQAGIGAQTQEPGGAALRD